jgi:nucleoside-diphosphate-sugar epimerase
MEAEIAVSQYVEKGLRAQILRPTIVFGSGKEPEQDSFLHLVRAIKNRRYLNINKGGGIYNIIHVDEVAQALCALDSDSLPNGQVFFINTPISFGEFADIVREATASKEKPIVNSPYWTALCATAAMTAITCITGKKMPLTFSRLHALTNRRVFLQDKIMRVAGYMPSVPVQESIRSVCHEYSRKGLFG